MTPTKVEHHDQPQPLAEVTPSYNAYLFPFEAKTTCGQCGGQGWVWVDSSDRRKGQTSCGSCGGDGEL